MKKFLLLTACLILTGCEIRQEVDLYLPSGQKDVFVSLDDYSQVHLFEVKEPVKISIGAPEGKQFFIGDHFKAEYSFSINPNESRSIIFDVVEKGELKKEIFSIYAYQTKKNPENRTEIYKRSGKYNNLVGYSYAYTIKDKQDSVLVDMFEHNDDKLHQFTYYGQQSKIKVVLKPPYGCEFIFPNGQISSDYAFELKKEQEIAFTIKIHVKGTKKPYDEAFLRKLEFRM